MPLSLDKVASDAPELLDHAKEAKLSLSKHNLDGLTAKAALALDFSGSMRHEYSSGAMQAVAEKMLAFATQMDDDGAIDLFFFHSGAEYLGEVNVGNFRDFLSQATANRRMGTTNYAGAFDLITNHYGFNPKRKGGLFKKGGFEALSSPADLPVHVTFITDGAPDSKPAAVESITRASYAPIFWQFISIGSENIPFLQKLDDLDGRYIDNADYKPLADVNSIPTNQLYDILLDEYPEWVAEEKKRGQVR